MWCGGSPTDRLSLTLLFHPIAAAEYYRALTIQLGRVVGSFQIIIAWLRAVWLFLGPARPWTHAMMTVMNKTDPEKLGPTPTQHSANGQILTGSPWKMGHMLNVINVIRSTVICQTLNQNTK